MAARQNVAILKTEFSYVPQCVVELQMTLLFRRLHCCEGFNSFASLVPRPIKQTDSDHFKICALNKSIFKLVPTAHFPFGSTMKNTTEVTDCTSSYLRTVFFHLGHFRSALPAIQTTFFFFFIICLNMPVCYFCPWVMQRSHMRLSVTMLPHGSLETAISSSIFFNAIVKMYSQRHYPAKTLALLFNQDIFAQPSLLFSSYIIYIKEN